MNLRLDGQRPTIDLADLIRDPSQASNVDQKNIAAMLTQLSAVQTSIAARLVAANQDDSGDGEDTLLTVEAAAKRLGISKDWLYRRTNKLPFVVRVGRHVR